MVRKFGTVIYKNSIKLFLIFCVSNSTISLADNIVEVSDSTIELLTESNLIEPGDELLVGFKFSLSPGWHTYWVNPGDGRRASINGIYPEMLKLRKFCGLVLKNTC